jgi:zinc protease
MTIDACAGARSAATPPAWNWTALRVVTTTLPNGLRVVFAENHATPLVFLSWTASAGFETDPPDLAGLASLTPLLVRQGTARRSGAQVTNELDDLGAVLAAGSDWDSAYLNLGLLSEDFAAGVDLLVDIACHAAFPPAAIARLAQQRLVDIGSRRQDAQACANDEFARALFGDSVYGRPPLGTPATVQRIDAPAVAAFHEMHYLPATSCLAVAGSVDLDVAIDDLGARELPSRDCASPRPQPPAMPAADPSSVVRVVDVPHAAQVEIRVGHAGIARDHEHAPALEVLGAIIGGGPTSRLARRLRQQEGLTYHVRSRFVARRLGGMFVVETSVAIEAVVAALAGIRREIERLREGPIAAAEVEQAKQSLFGGELRRFQDLIGTGSTLGAIALHTDPVVHLERRRQARAAVEPEILCELARRYLHPERLVTVVAGPADSLRSQLSSGGASWCQSTPLGSTS